MEVIFGFSILENIKFTKNIPCSWKKNIFADLCYLEALRRKTKILSQYCRSPGKVCNRESLEQDTISDHSTLTFGVLLGGRFCVYVMLCITTARSLVGEYERFGGICRLNFQSISNFNTEWGAAGHSETSVTKGIQRCYNSEVLNLNFCPLENFKFHTVFSHISLLLHFSWCGAIGGRKRFYTFVGYTLQIGKLLCFYYVYKPNLQRNYF
jgi:hypothetical protein